MRMSDGMLSVVSTEFLLGRCGGASSHSLTVDTDCAEASDGRDGRGAVRSMLGGLAGGAGSLASPSSPSASTSTFSCASVLVESPLPS